MLIDAAPHRVEGDGLSSFRLLASERLENAGEESYALPVQYAWFEPVLIATIVVFIIDLVGNSIGFGNRFVDALMSAIVFSRSGCGYSGGRGL